MNYDEKNRKNLTQVIYWGIDADITRIQESHKNSFVGFAFCIDGNNFLEVY